MCEVWDKCGRFEAICEIYNPRTGHSFKVCFAPILYQDSYGLRKVLGLPLDRSLEMEGPLYLAGFGITKNGWDDYKGSSAGGKIVIVLSSVPKGDDSAFPMDPYGSLDYKVANAIKHEAKAIVHVNNPIREWNEEAGGIVHETDGIMGICFRAIDMMLILAGEDSKYATYLTSYQEEIEKRGPLGLVPANLNMTISFKGNEFQSSESEHFIYYYRRGSLAEEDLPQIANEHEGAYAKLSEILGLRPKEKIRYVLFPSAVEKRFFTGHIGAGAARDHTFYEIYNRETKVDPRHELCHILAGEMGSPPALFNEGLAMYMGERDFRTGKIPDQNVREILGEGKYIPLDKVLEFTDIGSEATKPEISYPEAGSFVGYLLMQYGFEKFRRLYSKAKNDEKMLEVNKRIIRDIYEKDINELEREWLDYLQKSI